MATPQPLSAFDRVEMHEDIELLKTGIATRPVNVVVTLASLIGDAVSLASLLVILGAVSPVLPMLAALLGGISFWLASRSQARLWEGSLRRNRASRMMSYLFGLAIDRSALPEWRLYSGVAYLKARFEGEAATAFETMNRVRRRVAGTTVWSLGAVAGIVFLMVLELGRVAGGAGLTVGQSVILLGALAGLQSSISAFAEQMGWVSGQLLFFERYFALLDGVSAESPPQSVPAQTVLRLEACALSHHYPAGGLAVSGVSFSAQQGEVILVRGRNGSGKSTLGKLLAGLYEPGEGQLLMNGVPLGPQSLPGYWSRIAFMAQDPPRLKLGAAEAVALCLPQPAWLADRLRDIGPELLPDTTLGVEFGGVDLSGGEWQRLAFLRFAAHAATRDVLILDEPTNHVDADTEARLRDEMARLFAGKLVFLITHDDRLTALATRVITLDEGRIVADDPLENNVRDAISARP